MILNKGNKRPASLWAGLFIFSMLVVGFIFCSGEEKEKQLSPKTGEIAQMETMTTQNMDGLLDSLLVIEERIKTDPANIGLRIQLVNMSLDSQNQLIRAAGIGLAPQEASSSAMAMQSAQRASYLDACRWVAYILVWKDYPDSLEFGTISGNLPGARTIIKKTLEDSSYSLVEIDLENN